MCVGCIYTKKLKCSGWGIIPKVKTYYKGKYSILVGTCSFYSGCYDSDKLYLTVVGIFPFKQGLLVTVFKHHWSKIKHLKVE